MSTTDLSNANSQTRQLPAGETASEQGKIWVYEVLSLDQLETLRPEWIRLWARCPWATPFQLPEWQLAWCRHFNCRKPWVLALRLDDVLVGMVPFCRIEDEEGIRKLLPLGTGISDYFDVLIAPECQAVALSTIWDYLVQQSNTWDLCDLQHLGPDSPLLGARLPESLRHEPVIQETCPVLPLHGGKADLAGYVPKRQCKRFLQHSQRLARFGKMRAVLVSESNVESMLNLLLKTYLASGSAAMLNFHREVTIGLLRHGLLRLLALEIDERPIAVHFGLLHQKRAYSYLHGVDPKWRRLKPAMVLMGEAICDAIGEGAEQFNFLSGNQAYKYEWGAKDQLIYRRAIWPVLGKSAEAYTKPKS